MGERPESSDLQTTDGGSVQHSTVRRQLSGALADNISDIAAALEPGNDSDQTRVSLADSDGHMRNVTEKALQGFCTGSAMALSKEKFVEKSDFTFPNVVNQTCFTSKLYLFSLELAWHG